MGPTLRESTVKVEGPLQISKLWKIPVLLDNKEMVSFLEYISSLSKNLSFFRVQGIQEKNSSYLTVEDFLKNYHEYLNAIKMGNLQDLKKFHDNLSVILTSNLDIVYSISINQHQELIKATKPVIQFQPNYIHFSKENFQINPLSHSNNAIAWGLHISYPQLYQDQISKEVISTRALEIFPNTFLFQEIQKWIRKFTGPTPFIINEKKVISPIRIGKHCFSWINTHPQLLEKGLAIQS